MTSWPAPSVPAVPGPPVPLRIHDTSSGELRPTSPGPTATLYVCGITPYDATHLGHAATYVTFDVVQRVWRDNGHAVHYVQNVTDVDDPLLERAERDGVDWRDLARQEIALFHEDMTALAVLPPDDYVSVVDSVGEIATDVRALVAAGAAYGVDVPDGEAAEGALQDVYYDVASQPRFGAVSSWTREQMLEVYAERGGDPDRPGKKDALDALLWRAARPGEPSWDGGSLGPGRPGWHVECSTIAVRRLGMSFDLQGGGTDLVFPHHEMSAAHAASLTGEWPFARSYVHQAMVGLDGHKMSKSRGNLVLVSALRRAGVDPMAIRLALLDHHYRTDWFYTDAVLANAQQRLDRWRAALSRDGGPDASQTLQHVRECLSDDLRTPDALAAVDRWADQQLNRGGDEIGAPGVLARALDAVLGVRL
ncbi:cysteine--1-D-myo-inosityl 2-amino-2-deoxy-alpha-D-glucopyranoside ligase [Angustibacter luteus]|uniref:L-cysteine:1D-myo-inositol 2-amino-2-deoxy-alpha-D-glucopyranoside ligase n=1 Tax=Angustibacter luteus TaxID=658456 RepID=A0ABW1JBB0_9ACTN